MTGGDAPMDAVVRDAAELLLLRLPVRPRVLLVLGSGLGGLADELDGAVRVPFREVPGFPAAAVAGHAGAVVGGRLEGVACMALQGRFHLYEGHAPALAALPVRIAAALGADTLLVTNAAGGINRRFRAGDLMLIDDHINLMFRNPLVGPPAAGEARFPDLSAPYDAGLQRAAQRAASRLRIPLRRGTYCAVLGPSYETPAEIGMLAACGADAVGMSTVPEVLAARAAGMRVLGLSLISNAAAGLGGAAPLNHDEVLEAGVRARDAFGSLVRAVLREPDLGARP